MTALQKYTKMVIDCAICIYLVLILGIMPFYNRAGYSRIGTDKAYFFNKYTVSMGKIIVVPVLLYLILLAIQLRGSFWKKLRSHLSVTDLFAAGYALALVLSYFCSAYKEDDLLGFNALWGFTGWYMGFWPQMFLILIYFFVSKLWKPRMWMLYIALTVSGAVFLLGYLNRFGVNPLNMTFTSSAFISTIGNINWYCGYMVSVFFTGTVFLWQGNAKKLWRNILLALYMTVGFGTLVTHGSDSGFVALSAVLLVMLCLSVGDNHRILMFWLEVCLLGAACVITWIIRLLAPDSMNYDSKISNLLTTGWLPLFMTFVSCIILAWVYRSIRKGTYSVKITKTFATAAVLFVTVILVLLPILITLNTIRSGILGPLSKYSIFTFSAEWGSHRGATWSIGWRCFAEQNILHKFTGIGPDCMGAYLYNGASQELNAFVKEIFGNSQLTNAHCEWLTILVNTGILGLVSFGGMILTGIWRFLRGTGQNIVTYACGFCLLAYTMNNIFSFQQSMSVATMFAIFGIGGAFFGKTVEKNGKKIEGTENEQPG